MLVILMIDLIDLIHLPTHSIAIEQHLSVALSSYHQDSISSD